MRSIETPAETERRERRNKLLIGIVLVGVMILSTAGYAFLNNAYTNSGQTQQKVNYNGHEFKLTPNSLWQTSLNGQDFQFQNLPNETQEISLKGVTLNFYSGKPLYMTSENPEAANEIASALGRYLPRQIQNVCVKGQFCTDDLPEKDCLEDNIIIIKEGNATQLSQQDHCVIIEGEYAGQINLADAFLYKILGIR